MPSKFGNILPWEYKNTCYLEGCDNPVEKHGDFCSEGHRDAYWEKILKDNKKYTLAEVQAKLEEWRIELKNSGDTLYRQAKEIFN